VAKAGGGFAWSLVLRRRAFEENASGRLPRPEAPA
jgi:hypothetical protein